MGIVSMVKRVFGAMEQPFEPQREPWGLGLDDGEARGESALELRAPL
jgi:hypothetical protein